MSTFLSKVLDSFFLFLFNNNGQKTKFNNLSSRMPLGYLRKRKLTFENLENRQLLSVNPLIVTPHFNEQNDQTVLQAAEEAIALESDVNELVTFDEYYRDFFQNPPALNADIIQGIEAFHSGSLSAIGNKQEIVLPEARRFGSVSPLRFIDMQENLLSEENSSFMSMMSGGSGGSGGNSRYCIGCDQPIHISISQLTNHDTIHEDINPNIKAGFHISSTGHAGSAGPKYKLSGTAEYGKDYTLSSTVPVIVEDNILGGLPSGGGSYWDIWVVPISDAKPEDDKTIVITLIEDRQYDLSGGFYHECHYTGAGTSETITIKDDDRWKVKVDAPEDETIERLVDAEQQYGYFRFTREHDPNNESGNDGDRHYNKEVRFTVTEYVNFEDPDYVPQDSDNSTPTYEDFKYAKQQGTDKYILLKNDETPMLDEGGNIVEIDLDAIKKYKKDYEFSTIPLRDSTDIYRQADMAGIEKEEKMLFLRSPNAPGSNVLGDEGFTISAPDDNGVRTVIRTFKGVIPAVSPEEYRELVEGGFRPDEYHIRIEPVFDWDDEGELFDPAAPNDEPLSLFGENILLKILDNEPVYQPETNAFETNENKANCGIWWSGLYHSGAMAWDPVDHENQEDEVEIKDGALCIIVMDVNNDKSIDLDDRKLGAKNSGLGKVIRVNTDDDDKDGTPDKWQRPELFDVPMN